MAAEPGDPAESLSAGARDTNRLEAFSDGVLAIAITLLILNVEVPRAGRGELASALAHAWPAYASYVVSFLIIGIIWVNHHALVTNVAKVDSGLLFRNLFLLLGVSFLPFPTALLADYVRESGSNAHYAAAVYGATMTFIGSMFLVIWTYLASHPHLLRAGFTAADARMSRSSAVIGPVLYGASVGLAFLSAPACLVLYAALALYFAVGWRPRTATPEDVAPAPGTGHDG